MMRRLEDDCQEECSEKLDVCIHIGVNTRFYSRNLLLQSNNNNTNT